MHGIIEIGKSYSIMAGYASLTISLLLRICFINVTILLCLANTNIKNKEDVSYVF